MEGDAADVPIWTGRNKSGWSTANMEEGQQKHSLVHCIDGDEDIGQAVDSKAQSNQRSSVFIAAVNADGHPGIRLVMKGGSSYEFGRQWAESFAAQLEVKLQLRCTKCTINVVQSLQRAINAVVASNPTSLERH